MQHPLSEQTIIKHDFTYKGFRYVNDQGHPCEYRVLTASGKDTGELVKYYKGRYLTTYKLV